MKVMLLKPNLLLPSNGGDISIIEYFSLFQTWGWKVEIHLLVNNKIREYLETHQDLWKVKITKRGYQIRDLEIDLHSQDHIDHHEVHHQQIFEGFFEKLLSERRPDVGFGHYTDFFATSSLCRWNPNRSFIFQTDNEFPRLDQLQSFKAIHESFSKIKNFLVASSFMKSQVQKAYPDSSVFELLNVLAILDSDDEISFDSNRYWTFVNPVPVKGRDFFLSLAKALPEVNFQVVENWGQSSDLSLNLENVRVRQAERDIRRVFKSAKGLLMPSIWEEAFGRLPLEAMHFGLPVLASNRGALPQTLGGGGSALDLDVKLWAEKINEVDALQEDWIKRAKDRVHQYRQDRDLSLKNFRDLIENIVR
ncbi:MAG: glycosyltransferase [Bdellovibrionota bacterium]